MSDADIPDSWRDTIQPKGLPADFDYRHDSIDAGHFEGIDSDGDVLVISDTDESHAYVASTLAATDYIDSRR